SPSRRSSDLVLVANVFIAAFGPVAAEGLARLGSVIPIHQGSTRALYIEVANLAHRYFCPIFVTQLHFITRNRLAGRAVTHVAHLVGQEDVQHLGGSDTVQDVAPEMGRESLAQIFGQRFAEIGRASG